MVGIQLIVSYNQHVLYGVCSHSSFCRHIPMLDYFKLKLCFSEPMSCRQDRPVVLPNGKIGVRTTSQSSFTGGCSITIVRLLGQLLKFAYEKKWFWRYWPYMEVVWTLKIPPIQGDVTFEANWGQYYARSTTTGGYVSVGNQKLADLNFFMLMLG